MKVLFDHCTPRPLRQFLTGHDVTTADQHGWEGLENGDLLDAADKHGFDVFITTDNKMEHQQNFQKRTFGTVFITKPDWPRIKPCIPAIREAIQTAQPGTKRHVEIPDDDSSNPRVRQPEVTDDRASINRSDNTAQGQTEPPPFRIVFEEREDGRFDVKWREIETESTKTLTSADSIRAGLEWLASKNLIPEEEIVRWERDLLEDLKRNRERNRGR